MLEHMGCTEEQMSFYATWVEVVGNTALAIPGATASVMVVSDMSALEFRITAATQQMALLAREFVAQCGVPDGQLKEMTMAQAEVGADTTTLWCKLKHIRTNTPAIDAGYTLNAPVHWTIADMLMPGVDDQDALRDYAVQEHTQPTNFGSSFFPTEPERRLTFEMNSSEELGQNPKKSLLSAFFFFKSLGFAKPEDNVVRLLSSSTPAKFVINVTMGPRGLTRLAVTLSQPTKMIARSLAEALYFPYDDAGVAKMRDIVGADVDSVDYAADSGGYAVALGVATAQ